MSDYIPEEIQVQILQCLPVRSLLRFRGVCKWWKQHIDSPSFLQGHLAVQKPRFLFDCCEPEFVVLDPCTLPLFDTLRAPTEYRYRLLGTLHGVVFLCKDDEDLLLLWNPSIRQMLALTMPQFLELEFEWEGDYFGTYSAFWIDPSTKDYKVLIFKFMIDDCDGEDGAIFSSIEGNWKVLPLGEVLYCRPQQECPAIVISGVAYWRAHYEVTNEEFERVSMDVVVLSFDFALERFDIIPAPSVKYYSWCYPILSDWQGTLSLVYSDHTNSDRCDIYLRQEGSWLHMFGFNPTPSIGRVLWVVGEMDERGKVLVQEMQQHSRILATNGGELVLCDTGAGYISVKIRPERFTEAFLAYGFVESLLLA